MKKYNYTEANKPNLSRRLEDHRLIEEVLRRHSDEYHRQMKKLKPSEQKAFKDREKAASDTVTGVALKAISMMPEYLTFPAVSHACQLFYAAKGFPNRYERQAIKFVLLQVVKQASLHKDDCFLSLLSQKNVDGSKVLKLLEKCNFDDRSWDDLSSWVEKEVA